MTITYDDVRAAEAAIHGVAHRTPVMTSRMIDKLTGASFYFKCENLQRVGAFKFRGAYNALSKLPGRQIVAFSSGNHAQAVAHAAQLLGLPATIVMPHDAPVSKLAATRGYGAEVVLYDRFTEDREAIAKRIASERGASIIPPFDHPDIIAGQGTAALELFDDVGDLDLVVTPLGGGGLLSGTALAARGRCKIYGVEPEAGNDGQRSLEAGQIVHIATPQTIADGAQTQHLGQLTFPIIQREVAGILTASDDELVDAMQLLFETMKIVVEPTGVLGLVGARKLPIAGKRVGVIVSGGNVDAARFASLISARSGSRPTAPSR
ncbi:MAG TPA: threo-3-hydroxy-L-aspartate ammonia-lyase [Kofleriaceae bacterium]|nr:threo-3-hydroxy-L-aspartate ammonia-lyase [Kofleriaceae bacterium]